MSKIYRNEKDPMIHQYDLSVNTGDYIRWLYFKFITCMLKQINCVNTFGTQ